MRPVPALVAVDMQREELADLPSASALTGRIGSAMARASAAGALVAQLQNDGDPGIPAAVVARVAEHSTTSRNSSPPSPP